MTPEPGREPPSLFMLLLAIPFFGTLFVCTLFATSFAAALLVRVVEVGWQLGR